MTDILREMDRPAVGPQSIDNSWPLLGGKPAPAMPDIPRARYLDEAFYRAELQHVFGRSWLFAGHVSQVPKPGSYRLLDIELAPVVLVRGKNGVLRAFLNSCQHRGASVLRDVEGCVKVLSCQYHGWTYNLEGKLVGLKDAETFPNFRFEGRNLKPVRCELWGGLIFINLDDAAPPLLDWLTPSLTQPFDRLVRQDLRVASITTTEIACNWKLSVEAFRESYHFESIHKDTVVQMADYRRTGIVLNRNGHGTLRVPYWPRKDDPAAEWDGQPNLSDLAPLDGTDEQDFLDNVVNPVIFPNTSMAFQLIGFPIVSTWPTGRGTCKVIAMWLGRDWGDGPRPAAWHSVLAAHRDVIEEDLKNLVSMQRSLEADPDKGITLSTQEVAVYQLAAESDNMIGADNVPPGLHTPDVLAPCYV